MSSIINWNKHWIFKKEAWENIDVSQVIDGEKVDLPHTWYKDDDYYQGDAVYQKIFTYECKDSKCTFVKFYGVDKVCRIFLNGKEVGHHEGGYNIFALDLTDEIIDGQNVMTILVSTDKKYQVSPISGDFAVFGGIHRKVELIETSRVCFDRTYFGTDGFIVKTTCDNGVGKIDAKVIVHGAEESACDIVYTIYDGDEIVMSSRENAFTFDGPKLWNGLDDTYLYTIRATLMIDGDPVDCVEKEIGFRNIKMDANEGFFLNGNHVKIHGVAKHQDTAGVFSAATIDHWKQDMELIHEIGANGVRLSHYPHPQEVYSLCDSMGFVVWAEIPLLKLTEDEGLFENAKLQLKEMILQNMHHPSICFWGLQNEIAIYGEFPYMKGKMDVLNELAHELDDSRFSVCANLNTVHSDSTLNQVTDATAYNIYYGWYYGQFEDHGKFLDEFHSVNPKMPLGISEYGADTNTCYHSDEPKVNDYSEEFQALYHETVYPMMAERDFVWGSFVWNMFDFTSPIRQAANIKNRNIKGLVTFDRKTRKDSFYYYKAMWSKEPFIHFASKRYENRGTELISVKVYSNQPEVTIKIHGSEFTEKVVNGSAVFENIKLDMGENRIVAKASNLVDEVVFNRQATADEAYVYVDQNPGLNVRNWFLDEQSESELFPEGHLSIRSTINDLLASDEATSVIDKRMPDVGKDIRDMVGTFSLEKFFSYTKPDYTEEEFKALNAELTKIAI